MMIMVKQEERRGEETTIDGASGSHGITCDHCAAVAAATLKSPESIRFVSEVS